MAGDMVAVTGQDICTVKLGPSCVNDLSVSRRHGVFRVVTAPDQPHGSALEVAPVSRSGIFLGTAPDARKVVPSATGDAPLKWTRLAEGSSLRLGIGTFTVLCVCIGVVVVVVVGVAVGVAHVLACPCVCLWAARRFMRDGHGSLLWCGC